MFLTDSIGRLHPALVHLPIGILFFAFALVLFQRFRNVDIEGIIAFALLVGSILAAATCVAGWFLAQSGEYDANLVFNHQWMGISTAVMGFLAYFIKKIRDILTTLTVVFLTVAGHLGGTLTHGEGYLFPKKKTPLVKTVQKADSLQDTAQQPTIYPIIEPTKSILKKSPHIAISGIPTPLTPLMEQKSFIYQDLVMPILEKKCYNCHSSIKKKGDLRLDSEEFIRIGGESGRVFTAGNPENSRLYTALMLPEDDDEHMPPKGKPQPTPEEILIIHEWIKKGAPFQEVIENVAANTTLTTGSTISKQLKTAVTDSAKMVKTPVKVEIEVAEAKILQNKVKAATPLVLDKLKRQNIVVSDFGGGSNHVMVNFVNVKNYNSKLIDDLQSIGNQLVRVKLSDQPVSDADVKKLTAFKNITRLNLEKTAITDAALSHLKNLPYLEQLNLYGTNITDKGLAALSKCPNLKVIYLWQTKTTAAGIEQLKKTLPNVQIDTGGFQFLKPDTNKIKS